MLCVFTCLTRTFPPFIAPFDLVFIVDGSKQVGAQTFKLLKDFVKQIVHAFQVTTQATRVGLAEISDTGQLSFNLDQYNEIDLLDKAIDDTNLAGGSRMTGQAVTSGYASIFKASGRRGLVPQVAVVVVTGKSEDDVASVGESLRKVKLTTIVVSAGQDVDKKQAKDLAASRGDVITKEDVTKLPTVVSRVVFRINKGVWEIMLIIYLPYLPTYQLLI